MKQRLDNLKEKSNAALRRRLEAALEQLRQRGVPVDRDFLEELSRNVKIYSAVVKKGRGLGRVFYQIPRAISTFGEEQDEYHLRWGDLFFDLTFVGASYRLGTFLETLLSSFSWDAFDDFVGGMFAFVALFIVIRSTWEAKLEFTARFDSQDFIHKCAEITEACLTAVLAVNIPTLWPLLAAHGPSGALFPTLFTFIMVRLGIYFFNLVRWMEILLLSPFADAKKQSQLQPTTSEQAKNREGEEDDDGRQRGGGEVLTALYYIVNTLCSSLPMCAAAALCYNNQPTWLVCLFLVFSDLFLWVDLVRSWFPSLNTRRNTVPLHLEAVIHREGDFFMLMLGEAVLGTILVVLTDPSAYFSVFVPGYLLIASIHVLHYSSQPFFAEGHALSRHRTRGTIWLKLQPVEGALVVAFGVALKVILKITDQGEDLRAKYWHVAWFLCIVLTILFLVLNFLQILHNGVSEELDLPWCARIFKIALYGCKAFVSLLFLLVPVGSGASGFPTVMGCLAVSVVAVILQRIWDGIDLFVATTSSALANEEMIPEEHRVMPGEFDEEMNGRAAPSSSSPPPPPPPQLIYPLKKILPARLRNTRVEKELIRLQNEFGVTKLERELRVLGGGA